MWGHTFNDNNTFNTLDDWIGLAANLSFLSHLLTLFSDTILGAPQRFAWMREWAFLVAWMRENRKKNCVNAWIEKTCVNVKIHFSIALMRESALLFAWTREFSLFSVPRLPVNELAKLCEFKRTYRIFIPMPRLSYGNRFNKL